MITLTHKQIEIFRQLVFDYYASNRRDLPWRKTTDPYQIMVSEVMLQQTQVDRVIPKYKAWLERFPEVKTLSQTSLREVLTYWSGLGYNRRGQNLWKAAQMLESEYGGSFQALMSVTTGKKDPLTKLPGIGPYTAAAIRAFAWNQPVIVIETNIRTVYIHHFFPEAKDKIEDKELLPLIEATLDKENPRDWYNALMDYGTYLKQTQGNATQRSKAYSKQSPFKGSKRRLRGMVIKLLTTNESAKDDDLKTLDPQDVEKLEIVVRDLINEGLIVKDNRGYYFINES